MNFSRDSCAKAAFVWLPGHTRIWYDTSDLSNYELLFSTTVESSLWRKPLVVEVTGTDAKSGSRKKRFRVPEIVFSDTPEQVKIRATLRGTSVNQFQPFSLEKLTFKY